MELSRLSDSVFVVHEHLHFLVDASARFGAKEFQAWIDQVWVDQARAYRAPSTDVEPWGDALRVLASLAPPSLEDTLINFAKAGVLGVYAPMAMGRLNTPRSRAVLADILRSTQPGTSEHYDAARYLGSSGDPHWFSILLADAEAQPDPYLEPVAESGGDRAIPFLMGLVLSGAPSRRQLAINAIGYTGSRAAVPVLLELLGGSDKDASDRAVYGLQVLTHRMVAGAGSSGQSQYQAWMEWWSHHRDDATIYKPTDCGEWVPLK
jgi:hypothetical protein